MWSLNDPRAHVKKDAFYLWAINFLGDFLSCTHWNKGFEPRYDKTNKVTVRPARIQISLGICPVWSESSLCAHWVAKDQSFLHADSENSDQTGHCWFCHVAAHFVFIVAQASAQRNIGAHLFIHSSLLHPSVSTLAATLEVKLIIVNFLNIQTRATENHFFAGSDRFLVCKTDSICIKRIFFGPKKTHFADHILAQFPGLVKCQTVNCP